MDFVLGTTSGENDCSVHLPRVLNDQGDPRAAGATQPSSPETFTFREYDFCPALRKLSRNGVQIALGSRAFDLLAILVRSRGRLVGKEDIIKEVWPSTYVEESNLRFQMAGLRRALGKDRDLIQTIPGRGYQFVDVQLGSAHLDAENSVSPGLAECALDYGDNKRTFGRFEKIACSALTPAAIDKVCQVLGLALPENTILLIRLDSSAGTGLAEQEADNSAQERKTLHG